MDGGTGTDYIFAEANGTSITLSSIANVEAISANTFSGVYISGTAAAENLNFSATTLTGIQYISMLGVNDTVTGSAAADVIYGGDGSDVIAGGGGGDVIYGDNGNDTLTGGLGADILVGGDGTNTFDFNSVAESSGASADLIWDFWQPLSDKIDLSTIDANTGLAGDQAFSFIGAAAFSGVAGELRFDNTTNPGLTTVYADNTGDSIADFTVHLNGTYTLFAADFIA